MPNGLAGFESIPPEMFVALNPTVDQGLEDRRRNVVACIWIRAARALTC